MASDGSPSERSIKCAKVESKRRSRRFTLAERRFLVSGGKIPPALPSSPVVGTPIGGGWSTFVGVMQLRSFFMDAMLLFCAHMKLAPESSAMAV